MLFAIESQEDTRPEYTPAIYFVGPTDEVEKYCRNFGSLVLGTLEAGYIDNEDAYSLFEGLADRVIRKRDMQVLPSVLADSRGTLNDRLRLLLIRASNG